MELENEENHRQAKRQIEREKGRREVVADMSEDLSEGEKGENINDVSVHIIRIPFGPKDIYVPKELLWPHVPEFVDGALGHVIQMSKVLGEQVGGGYPVWPVTIHGHYADVGDSAAARLSGALNVPMPFTGHSLGRDKLEQLLRQGRLTKHEINATYKIMRRIEGEENSLDASDIVISRTRQEIEQWRLYDGFDPVLEKILRARIRRNVSCYGRFMPRMVVSFQKYPLSIIQYYVHFVLFLEESRKKKLLKILVNLWFNLLSTIIYLNFFSNKIMEFLDIFLY